MAPEMLREKPSRTVGHDLDSRKGSNSNARFEPMLKPPVDPKT